MNARDDIWDALEEHFGPVRTPSERGRRNLAVKELREAGALKEEIGVAYRFCVENFTTFTELALANHFSRAQHLNLEQQALTAAEAAGYEAEVARRAAEKVAEKPRPVSLVKRMAENE